MSFKKEMPSQKRLKELFTYEKSTGLLKRKIPRPGINGKKGSIVGTAHVSGYVVLTVDNKGYLAHRVIWQMQYGNLRKNDCIDHINGDRMDNRIANLRKVNEQENNRNQKRSVKNTSGCTGVHKRENGSWAAYITVNKKRKYLGSYQNIRHAVAARKKAEIVYKFHPNHDREVKVKDIDNKSYLKKIIEYAEKENLLETLKSMLDEKTNNKV